MNLISALNNLKEMDINTYEHSIRVGNSIAFLATASGFSPEMVQTFREAGYAHDLGKMTIMPYILSDKKISDMSEPEAQRFYSAIQRHTLDGRNITKMLTDSKQEYVDAASYHHTSYRKSQTSYNADSVYATITKSPYKGLEGEGIPIVARMCAICDVYDALSYKRSYKEKIDHDDVLSIMDAGAKESKFDPKLYSLFKRIVAPCLKNTPEEKKTLEVFKHDLPRKSSLLFGEKRALRPPQMPQQRAMAFR